MLKVSDGHNLKFLFLHSCIDLKLICCIESNVVFSKLFRVILRMAGQLLEILSL